MRAPDMRHGKAMDALWNAAAWKDTHGIIGVKAA